MGRREGAKKMKIQRLCDEHLEQYTDDFGDDGGAVLGSDGSCVRCERHQSGCICADCSGAELTAEK